MPEKARRPVKMTRNVINQKTSVLVFENHMVFYNILVYYCWEGHYLIAFCIMEPIFPLRGPCVALIKFKR